jgi:hypothetical protein
MTVISYPIPAYSNVPIEPQFYKPRRFEISNIIKGLTTLVTATDDLDYTIGQLVRLIIPPTFGIRQLNEQLAYVISIPSSTQVILDIDSRYMDSFKNSTATTRPQILGVGDINTGYVNDNGQNRATTNGDTQINIQGSFINISPQ